MRGLFSKLALAWALTIALAAGAGPAAAQSVFFPGTGSSGAAANASASLESLTPVTVTASGTVNQKGPASSSMGTTANAWSRFTVYLYAASNSGNRYLCDLSFDGVPTWTVTNLFAWPGTATTGTPIVVYSIPLAEPAGSVVKARCQSNGASGSLQVHVIGEIANSNRPPGYTTFTSLTADTTNTRAATVDVVLNGGSWVNILDPTAGAYSALIAAVDSGTSNPATSQQFVVRLATGTTGGGGETEVASFIGGLANANPLVRGQVSTLLPLSIASGKRISAQITGAGTPGTDAARIGLYALQ